MLPAGDAQQPAQHAEHVTTQYSSSGTHTEVLKQALLCQTIAQQTLIGENQPS